MINTFPNTKSSVRSGPGFNVCLDSTEDSCESGTQENKSGYLEKSNHELSCLKSRNKKPQKKEMHKNFQMKLKTEICKFYQLGFVCPHGDRCSFAHGASDLKQMDYMASKYRTLRCTKFHKKLYCQYGSRCQFVHRRIKKGGFKGMKPTYQQVLECFENLPEYNRCKQGGNLLDWLHESSLEVFKLPKLSVFELIRSA